MHDLSKDLGPLHVERHGTRGPTLLCWPSLFCDVRTLRPLVDAFGRDHQLLLIDGPGHGRSSGPTRPFPMEACADAAIRALDAAGVERATWIGVAWGGHVGTVAALRHPRRLRALVTMNAPMGARTGLTRLFFQLTWWLLRLRRSRALARKIATTQIAPARLAQRPDLVEPIIECILQSARRPFLAAVRSAMVDRPSLIPRLGDLRLPTLFISGSEDGLLPLATAQEQAAAIPNARFEVVTGTAHQSLLEDPPQVLLKLQAFLQEVERDAAPPDDRRSIEAPPRSVDGRRPAPVDQKS
jgi:pimeloyl-ACP methyl ester carboxylesterase